MGVQGLRKFIGAMSCTKTIYPREPKRTGGGSRSHSAPANLSSASPATKSQTKDKEMQARVAAQVETIFRGQQHSQAKADAKEQSEAQSTASTNSAPKGMTATAVTLSNGGSATPTATGRLPTAQHVLFDLNSLIHSCFNKLDGAMSTPQNTIEAVKVRMEEILTTIVCPTRTLTVCLDGPAPLAKIRTQRLRRRRVSTVNMAHSKQFSELSITAGSSFMVKLEREIAVFLQNRYADLFGKQNASSHHNPHQRKVEIYLHGSTSAGEGESKISQMLAFHAYNPNTPYHPNDTVVIIGNDIDLTLTAMGCMYYHNTFVLSPSALQAFCVGDIIYRWLCPGSGFLQDAHYLPSARADLIYLFSLNGGDHFPGVGEAAADLWRRYKLLRSTNPSRMIVSEDLLSVDLGFLGDILQVNEYEGQADPYVGLTLLRAALWATFTIVTGTCPDYRYTVPDTLMPSVSNLKAAIVANRTRSNACTIKYNPNAAPLTPLATYTAVMPTLEMFPDGALKALNTVPNNTKVNVRTLQAVHGGGGEDGGNNVSYRLQPVNLTLETIKKQLANVNDTNLIVSGVEGLLKMATDHGFLTPAEAARNSFTPPVHLTCPSAERQKKIADFRKEIGRGRLPENIKRKKEDELKALMAEGPSFEIQPIHVRQPTNLGAAATPTNATQSTSTNNSNSYGSGRNPTTAGAHPPLTIDDNYYSSIRELTFTNIFNYSVSASFDDFEAAANAKIAAREAAAAAANDDAFIMDDDESPDAMMVAEEMNSFDRLLKRHTSAAASNASVSANKKNTTAAAAASAATILSKTTIGSNVVRRIPVVQEIPEHLRAIREKAVKIQNKDKMQRDFTDMLKGKRDREVADDDDNTRHKSNKDGSAAAAAKKGARVEGGIDGAAVGKNKKNSNTLGGGDKNKKGGRGMEDDEDYDADAMADLDVDDDDDGANTRKKGSKKGNATNKKGRSLADLSDDDDEGGFAGAFVDDYSDDEAGGFDEGFGAGSKTVSSKKKKSGGKRGKQ